MSAENPADTVIEQAARIIIDRYPSFDPISAAGIARALRDENVLADPADRDDAAEDLVSVKVEVPLLRARLKRVEAERDQLRRWKAEAIPVMLGLQDLGRALGVRLGTRITGEAAAEQARALKAERDHAKEALALAEKDRQTYHRDAIRAEAAANDHYASALECSEEALTVAGKLSAEQEANEALREQIGIEVRSREQWESNAERAEAEVAELRATVERVATLRDRWAILAGQAMDADNRAWLNAASKTLRTVLAKGR